MKKIKYGLKILIIAMTTFSAQAAPYLSGQLGYNGQGTNDMVNNLFNHNRDRQLGGRDGRFARLIKS